MRAEDEVKSAEGPAGRLAPIAAFVGLGLVLFAAAMTAPLDYDEELYVSGAYFARSLSVYRDFVSVQPPLYTWLAWLAFTLVLVVAFPRWIAPLFNRFTPLEEGELRARIERLLARCGFTASGLFVMDGSRRSSHGNAYFTGFGRTKRIVFFDTLIERLTPDEIEAVLAHELGHFARGHIPRLLSVRFALALGLLGVLGWLYNEPAFHRALGLPQPHIGALLAGFSLIVPVFTFPFQPLASLMARRQEFEADAFAAQHASAASLASALAKLYRDNASTLTPDPLHSLVYDSHPPAALRIDHLRKADPLNGTAVP